MMSDNISVTSPKKPTAGISAKSEAELPVESEASVFSVEELNRQIRQLIEGELGLVWVQGEISNFKAHTSGHYYFSLKDSKSQISAVMFRGNNSRLKFKPTDGLEVIVRGRVSVYEPRGNYQIVAEMMEPVGAGALQKAYEQLKEKLKAEGLFENARKRSIPTLPRHIAIVTSPTGAAIRDMMNVLGRRNKTVPVTLVPTIVQGEGSAKQICEALKKAWSLPNVDVIIIGRGGGSIEDLWAFNDETLARMIAQSPVPVISAVGHEIDFTIADFVADLRAPTPSAAAELVVRNSADLVSKLESMEKLLMLSISKVLKSEKQHVQNFTSRLIDPKRTLQNLIQRNDELFTRLNQSVGNLFKKRKMEVRILTEQMTTPEAVIAQNRTHVDKLSVRMNNKITRSVETKQSLILKWMSVLDSLSPLKVVERGYSVTTKNTELVKSINQLKIGDEVNVKLMQGEFLAEVKKLIKG